MKQALRSILKCEISKNNHTASNLGYSLKISKESSKNSVVLKFASAFSSFGSPYIKDEKRKQG